MKKTYIALTVLLILASCKLNDKVKELSAGLKDQISFLQSQQKLYGGSWSSSLGGDCFTVEVTNSRLSSMSDEEMNDAMYAIGKALRTETYSEAECIVLELINDKKTGAITTSKSEHIALYNLSLLNRFFDGTNLDQYKEIEYQAYLLALTTSQDPRQGEVDQWLVDQGENHPDFAQVVKSTKKYFEEGTLDAGIDQLLESTDKALTAELIATYYLVTQQKKQRESAFLKAQALNPEDSHYSIVLASIWLGDNQNEKALSELTTALENHPEDYGLKLAKMRAAYLADSPSLCEDIAEVKNVNKGFPIESDIKARCPNL
ncbi:MAG: hypothetical protein KTR13_10300 [Saprospiraceae bacterium]|nr:hypothetical protein [Saprospiraceae bacterium]